MSEPICRTGKTRHTYGAAKRHLRELRRTKRYADGEVYQCPLCLDWHVGRRRATSRNKVRGILDNMVDGG